MSIVLVGSTSGSITLQEPAVAGTTVLDLPATSGTVAITSQIPAAYTNSNVLTLFNASGSAPVYACRAWVNFNGQGTVAIRASGNVTSITDNAEGDYTINFTNAMSDANYAAIATANQNAAGNPSGISVGYPDNSSTILYSTTQVRFLVKFGGGSSQLDPQNFSAAIFR